MRRNARSRSPKPLLAALVTLWGCSAAAVAGPPGPGEEWVTLSVHVPAPSNDPRDLGSQAILTLPDCPAGKEFLVLGVAGGPSVNSSSDARRVAAIGSWAVFVRFAQRTATTASLPEHRLTAFGSGVGYASSSLPAGQPAGLYPTSTSTAVGVTALADYRGASGGVRFRIDVTGACGTYSVR